MTDNIRTVIIRENHLTEDLRNKCKAMIQMIKELSLSDRRLHYEELHLLLKELIDNKTQNYNTFTKRLKENVFCEGIEVVSVLDKETEEFINEISQILTNEIDNLS